MQVAPYDAVYELRPSRLRAFRVGRLSLLEQGRPTGLGIPVLAYVLDAPGGVFLVDAWLSSRPHAPAADHAGTEDAAGGGTQYLPEPEGAPLVDQLAELEITPQRLVCTHLHEDHAGGAAAVGLAIEASSAELEQLAAAGAASAGYPVDTLRGLPTRAIELDPARPLGPFPASAGLADGVIAVDTAGHTPGSISVLACIGPAWALVCGDAVYPRMDQPESPAFRGALRLRRAIDDLPGMRPFPAHDTVVLRSGGADAWLGPNRL